MNEADSIFHRAVSRLLIEIFDGPPGDEAYILNPGDPGLHRQLEGVTAAEASRQPVPGRPSIAAHVAHVHFGLSLLVRWIGGEENPWVDADWDAAWRQTAVSETEWRALLADLKAKADTWQRALSGRASWDDVAAAGALSAVAHTAYHLGAIRQVLAAVRTANRGQ
jgi:hypothetical protein